MGRATWDTGWFQAEIFKALMEKLGYRVEGPKTFDTSQFYRAAARGDIDFWANGWFPLHNAFINDEAVRGKVELVGYEVKGGALQGYLIDKKSSQKHRITNLEDLKDPKVARLFDRDGNGRADLIGCNVGWGCELVIEHHLDKYKLRDTVEHIQGDYSLLIHDTVSRYRQGEPVLFYTWTPNWTVGTLVPGEDVVWLEVPFASLPEDQQALEDKSIIKGIPGCVRDPCAIGWPPNDIRVVANSAFLQKNPGVRRLLESVVIPLEDIDAENARMISGEGADEDFRRHALEWIEKNRESVNQWLAEARAVMEERKAARAEVPSDKGIGHPTQKKTLRIATMAFEPLVIYKGREYSGFSIELWKEIADEMDVDYKFYSVNSLAKLLDDVERGVADLATAGIGITSKREMFLDFSHPFFESGLQIMVRGSQKSVLRGVVSKITAAILSSQLIYVVSFLLLLLFISAHIIWLSERRHNPQFPKKYFKGIWESFWWAAVTVTTVGYGDKTPKGSAGRAFALLWMFSGFFILAYFTASVTSTVTVQQLQGTITGPKDLYGKAVATIRESTAADYLRKMGVPAHRMENLQEAIQILRAGEVDAVVYDAPVLQYYASHEGNGEVRVVGQIFWKQEYGIALKSNSPHREAVNQSLLRVIEKGKYQLLYKEWFGSEEIS
jgi:ABC-type proline/glycine betaine transport system substrate-binding protein/ABC-type amino acid transport substrate-binding protein